MFIVKIHETGPDKKLPFWLQTCVAWTGRRKMNDGSLIFNKTEHFPPQTLIFGSSDWLHLTSWYNL